jgi:ribosomal protein S18 acetylase RimI-like enzyme
VGNGSCCALGLMAYISVDNLTLGVFMPLDNKNFQGGISIRPARPADQVFIERLYRSTRDDLCQVDAEDDFIDELIGMQFNAQQVGYGDMYPNAMYFVVEKQQESIGRIVVDFGRNDIRVIDIAFIPQARGRGYGEIVLRAMQKAAQESHTPLTLCVQQGNFAAKQLYHKLGFRVTESTPMHDQMIWYPDSCGPLTCRQ